MRRLGVLPFFKDAYRMMETLAEHEQMSRSELAGLQLEKINRVWRHAITHVPYYKELFHERNLPGEFRSINEYTSTVPVLEKAAVRSGMLLSEKARPGTWRRTSGSTGVPLATYLQRDAALEMTCCQYRARALWGVDVFDRTAMLVATFAPGLAGFVGGLRRSVVDFLRDRVRFSASSVGREDLRRYLRKIKNFKPALLYGYSSAVYLLALETLESGVGVDSLKLVILTAEPVTRGIHEVVQRAFRTNVVEEYGAMECNVIAYEDDHHLLRVREDLVMVETLPTQDDCYRIIISVLNNPSFPLLRYDIGDLTEKPLSRPKVGFSILGPIIGRSNDFLVSGSGRRVWVDRVIGFDTYLVKHGPSVKRYRAHQSSNGRVLLLLEVDSLTEKVDVTSIRKKLSQLLEGQIVEVTLTESIPAVSGKHRYITSELA